MTIEALQKRASGLPSLRGSVFWIGRAGFLARGLSADGAFPVPERTSGFHVPSGLAAHSCGGSAGLDRLPWRRPKPNLQEPASQGQRGSPMSATPSKDGRRLTPAGPAQDVPAVAVEPVTAPVECRNRSACPSRFVPGAGPIPAERGRGTRSAVGHRTDRLPPSNRGLAPARAGPRTIPRGPAAAIFRKQPTQSWPCGEMRYRQIVQS
jgi:hypothetical protein